MEEKGPPRRTTSAGRAKALLPRRPPPRSDASRRGVPEAKVVELLMTGGYAHLIAEGQGEEARGLASEALDRWVSEGLAHETGPGDGRRFDPAEVVNGLIWAGLQGRDDFWSERWIATQRRMTRDLATLDPDARALVRVSLVRHFDLAAFPQGAELLLRAPLPLAGPDHAVADLVPEVREPVFGPLTIDDGRMTARLRRGPAVSATLGWTATLAPCDAPAGPPNLTAAETELYLRPAEGLIRVSSRVCELAVLWAGCLSGWEAVVAFWRGMNASFCLGVVAYEEFDAAGAIGWVLDNGWFDCVLGSALLVSLCRAHGMPSRLVSGHFLYPPIPSIHTWAEAWIDGRGWTPVDLAGWNLSAGGDDTAWRDVFLGRVDVRMVTERPPRRVTGPMSVRFPPTWRILHRAVDGVLEISTVDAASGRALVTDRLRVQLAPTVLS